ncbi:hypothetical protein CF15_03340 [Pyrodictium occultum]|uniref:Dihydroorotate dehydrogenase electron transfer subunit iron-sulphur cluster binding domain-containing protein n=1 Tax=Pyrodictium occultum TaxID=2309 RepID=A0A0V8RUV8_PYROC|nr:hypothetical protein [Pyrodictium occultum]KSW11849.1 hypothetical protein CF15_03340 [Pyrodictium occultum]
MSSSRSRGASGDRRYDYCSLKLRRILWRGEGVALLSYQPLGCRPPVFEPAQFAMFWVPGMEAVPLAPIYSGAKRLDFLVKARGPTTRRIVEEPPERAGIIGPMGRGFKPRAARLLLAAGGTGAASLTPVARWAADQGATVVFVYGARSAGELAPVEGYLGPGVELVVATENGSRGRRGTVVDVVEDLGLEGFDAVAAAGPEAMLCRLYRLAAGKGLLGRLYLSLETMVRCGMGFCGACLVPCTGILLCREGPVLPAAKLGCWAEESCRQTR